ncbi:MAG: phage terminase large subunit family protein [Candidatus Thorarchaeota archaeon]
MQSTEKDMGGYVVDLSNIGLASPAMWVEQNAIKLANGDTYSFKDRPYLIDPLNTLARLVCVRKARGLGFSETFILKSIHGLMANTFNQGVQYVFPTDTDMRKFVQSRFNVVLKKNPQTLGKLVKDTDTTYYKRVGEGNLFMDGGGMNRVIEGLQAESMTFRGTQVDMAVIDELDMFDSANEVIHAALTSMMNSDVKSVHALSNPSIDNYGIDLLFQKSNQNYWFRGCRCGELTCPDLEFPNLIDRKGCHCWKCGDVLGYRGIWKSQVEKRKDLYGPTSKDWEGYHISDLNAPKVDPFSILEQWQDKSDANQEKVNKFSLGLPYLPKTSGLTLAEVYECCGIYPEYDRFDGPAVMGVDVGKTSGFHVVIGFRTGKDHYEIIQVDCLEDFEEVEFVGNRYGVEMCVCDMLPEATYARKFQRSSAFRVWLCLYNLTNPVDEVVWNQDDRVVKVYRNYVFDTSHRLMSEKRIKLPRRSRKIEDFAHQYVVPIKIPDIKRPNAFKYFSRSDNDHYRNAMNYFYLAARNSKVTDATGRRKQRRTKCIYEPVRL